MSFQNEQTLKSDVFGSIEKGIFVSTQGEKIVAIKRVYTNNYFFRPLAKWLARNEKQALKKLTNINNDAFPQLLEIHKNYHIRSFIAGNSMHKCAEKLSPRYFSAAKKILKQMRKAGVCNNDLAKEANWIVSEAGLPVITDFQLALCFSKTKKMWLSLCHEDLRHLLKHKRKYDHLTYKEKKVVNTKSLIGRIWMNTGKKLHRFVTRKILGWQDRVGPEERNI